FSHRLEDREQIAMATGGFESMAIVHFPKWESRFLQHRLRTAVNYVEQQPTAVGNPDTQFCRKGRWRLRCSKRRQSDCQPLQQATSLEPVEKSRTETSLARNCSL